MSRITAFLGLDTSAFQAGIDRANTMVGRFKGLLKTGDIGGGLRQMLGAGAIIQGFRSIIQAAQDARDEARKLGQPIDAATASVAAYADRWDQAKDSVVNFGIQALSVLTRVGRAMGQAMGTGSSDEEVSALSAANKAQEQTDQDLKSNRERIDRELQSATKDRDNALREARMAGLTDKQREKALEEEISEIREKRAGLKDGSIEAVKAEAELAKRITERNRLQKQIEDKPKVQASDLTTKSSAFQMSLEDVATQRPAGRRSERERLAAEVLALEERGKRAESAGRFDLARNFRERAIAQANRLGFTNKEADVRVVRPGDRAGAGVGMGAADPNSWDARFGAQIAARNAALQAQFGGTFKRPDSFEQVKPKEEIADKLLQQAAMDLKAAAAELKNIEVEIDEEG